jgi:DNA-binding response OmpR family regulator
MARILLIDDDPIALNTIQPLLGFAHHTCAGALNGSDGIRVAEAFDPDVAVVDLMLPDMSGLDLIRELRQRLVRLVCIIATGHWSRDAMLEGLRVGACDWLDKPLFIEDLTAAITRALLGRQRKEIQALVPPVTEAHAVKRLAQASVMFIGSRRDERTLYSVGRAVGHASGCLRNWCRAADINARRFRDFTRALRAVYQLELKPQLKEANVLEIIDERTIRRFRLNSGGAGNALPHCVHDFLDRQQFLADPDFLDAVRVEIESRVCTDCSRDCPRGSRDAPTVFSV